jgi:hypothetical protein
VVGLLLGWLVGWLVGEVAGRRGHGGREAGYCLVGWLVGWGRVFCCREGWLVCAGSALCSSCWRRWPASANLYLAWLVAVGGWLVEW